jgi:tol-pal system protein YbgF
MGAESARAFRRRPVSFDLGTGRRSGAKPDFARGLRPITAGSVLLAVIVVSGCYPPSVLTLRGGLDSLRTVVDTLAAHDTERHREFQQLRRDIADQKDILLSTRATSGSTTQEMFEQMERLEAKLNEVMGRFNQIETRAPSGGSSGGNAAQLYDEGMQDLTQGRYPLGLQNFREYLALVPSGDLSDNAQYGVGECFFAQSRFDSAAVEYARVEQRYPTGDKVPAALYKLALSQEKLGESGDAKKTFERLVNGFPLSGEAQLARERLGNTRRR